MRAMLGLQWSPFHHANVITVLFNGHLKNLCLPQCRRRLITLMMMNLIVMVSMAAKEI